MIKKIVSTLTVFLLIILPFLVGNPLTKFSPYVEANSFNTYVLIWTVLSIACTVIAVAVLKYYTKSLHSLSVAGLLLFLLLCPIAGIIGLASAPDLSLKLLEHPEREHLRYIFLFIAAILFGIVSVVLLRSDSLKIKNLTGWIITCFFILAFAEFIWEFSHHYLYPEAMKEWIDQGQKPETFGKYYDNGTIITIGAIGRLIQFSLIIWLSLHFYKLRSVKIWSPILTILFGVTGIASAIFNYLTQMQLPKGAEILMLFFIPGIPFLLLYWLGVGLLTKLKREEIAV